MTAYSALTFPSKRKITEEQDCRGGMMKNLCSVTIGQVYDTFFLGVIELKDRNNRRLVVLCHKG